MTITQPTTEARTVVAPAIPEATVPTEVLRVAQKALELTAEVEERLDVIDRMVATVRDAFHDVVLELAPAHPGAEPSWVDPLADRIGWTELWEALTGIGDRYGDGRFQLLDLSPDELARGERDFGVGTTVTLADREGVPTHMTVEIRPGQRNTEQPGHYTLRRVEAPHLSFLASHAEIKAALASGAG